MLNSWLGRITSRLSRKERVQGQGTPDAALIARPAATGSQLQVAGTAKGWLRYLTQHADLESRKLKAGNDPVEIHEERPASAG